MGIEVPSFIFGDVSVQATASTAEPQSGIAVLARRDARELTGYGGSLKGGTLSIFRADGNVRDVPLTVLASQNVSLPSDDVQLRLDIDGDQLNLTAWSATDPMPTIPQVSARDSRYSEGRVGVAFQEGFNSPTSTGIFDRVTVTGDVLSLSLHDDFAYGSGQWSEVDFTPDQPWGPAPVCR